MGVAIQEIRDGNLNDLLCRVLTGNGGMRNTIHECLHIPVTIHMDWWSDPDQPLTALEYRQRHSITSYLPIRQLVSLYGANSMEPPTGALLSLHSATDEDGRYCSVISPRVESSLSGLAMRWLYEPMPELWLLALNETHSDLQPTDTSIHIHELQHDLFGLFMLRTGTVDYRCYSAWRVFPEGLTRLDWLLQAQLLNKQYQLNPLAHNRLLPSSAGIGILFRSGSNSLLLYMESGHHFRAKEYLNGSWRGVLKLHADYLAVLATLYRYTELQPNEIAALAATWWLYSLSGVAHIISSQVAGSSSLLLLTDMMARMPVSLREHVTTLAASRDGYKLSELSWHPTDDMHYAKVPYYADRRERLTTGVTELYDTIRVVSSQFGLMLPRSISSASYHTIWNDIEETFDAGVSCRQNSQPQACNAWYGHHSRRTASVTAHKGGLCRHLASWHAGIRRR